MSIPKTEVVQVDLSEPNPYCLPALYIIRLDC